MKKFIFRILAFGLDYIILAIVFLLLSFIPINSNGLKEVNNELNNNAKEYSEILDKITTALEDKKIEESEIFELPEEYKKIKLEVKEYSDDDIKKLSNELMLAYQDKSLEAAVKQQRLSVPMSIISIVIILLYFGVLQYYLKGQTIGKKVFKLKVYNVEDKEKEIPLINYLIRGFLISGSIFSIINSILCYVMDMNTYSYAYNYIFSFQTIYIGIFAIIFVFTESNRSIHDYILKTNVELTNNLS